MTLPLVVGRSGGCLGRRILISSVAGAALAVAGAIAPKAADAETVLRVGMTAADIPLTTGQPDQGFEGFRFMGYMLYDPLVLWDLSKADESAALMPGLAESWEIDPEDENRWIFTLRQGVTFHDGSPFTADAVIWNFEKVRNQEAPQYDPRQAALVAQRIPGIASVEKIDDYTVAVLTEEPNAYIPYQVSFWFMSSPAQWEKVGGWSEFAAAPSGTGPWKFTSMTPRANVHMAANTDYWDPDRVPKVDRVVLRPIPEASARVAALLSGQVDFIEAPPPDSIDRLRRSGMEIVTNAYPHNWAIKPSRIDGSPWNDIRVRKAANLCIDRDGMTQMLGGLAIPSKGHVPPGDMWFGEPEFDIGYRPDEARELMAEAGFPKEKPLTVKIAISTSGSGQMQPLPMFEYLQSNLNECHFNVEAEVMEWNALLAFHRKPANDPEAISKNISAVIVSHATQDPYSGFERFFLSSRISPAGSNWGMLVDNYYDEMLAAAAQTFDIDDQNEIIRKVHEYAVNNAEWIWVVHDVNPRAHAPHVKGFVQAQSWFQDLTPISIER